MFSSRTRWDLRPNRLAERVAAARARGARLLDLTEANPTRAGIACPSDVLLPLTRKEARRYDPSPFGLPSTRQAVADDLARRGYPVGPDQVLLTASTSEAYAFLFKLLADPGDEILVPRPGYPLFEFLAGLESVETRGYTLAYDGEWHLDLSALRSAVSERTRAVVIVNPNNPTGVFLKKDERLALEELCAERSLALVSDEVFADFGFGQDARREGSLASAERALAFALGGLSKSCALPQLKLAWMAVAGPAALRRDALARLEVIADSYLSVSTPVQVAAPELLARREELQAPIRVRTAANLTRLRERLPGSPATVLTPEGGWYACLRVPATVSEEERVLRLVDERHLLVHPGYFFDFPREAYLVLSLLAPEDDFAEGVERLLADLVL
ncbi:MAG TPA: pyridoxal phosphate-dependent aminotransferase [Vicinamibacteria bacterium]|nr:pyridoxal phosphate-dependent aminotransferase [Vicinamibacteria bacterium]